MSIFEGKRILITGGTGSLGQTLTRRILSGEHGTPEKVIIFSRDEAKQHFMRLDLLHREKATDEIIYNNSQSRLAFHIGDVRDINSLKSVMRGVHMVINGAALKQVPSCEYFPFEAVQTNVIGAENLIRAIAETGDQVETVIGVSTDKACKPINVMGMTKALQERIVIEANRAFPDVRLMCVRYGNVIASRGSIVPLFVEQARTGQPMTVTLPEMTRFLLSLDRAVDTVFAAIIEGRRGETYIPKVSSANIVDLAKAIAGRDDVEITFTGIRPGEKIHEIMISEEECYRTVDRGEHYAILPVLPELRNGEVFKQAISDEYSSKDGNLPIPAVRELLSGAGSEIEKFLGKSN